MYKKDSVSDNEIKQRLLIFRVCKKLVRYELSIFKLANLKAKGIGFHINDFMLYAIHKTHNLNYNEISSITGISAKVVGKSVDKVKAILNNNWELDVVMITITRNDDTIPYYIMRDILNSYK